MKANQIKEKTEIQCQLQNQQHLIHPLGGHRSPKKSIQKSQFLINSAQEKLIKTFSASNPLFYLHQALHKQPLPQIKPDLKQKQKTFQNVLTQIHEMRQTCQNLLGQCSKSKKQFEKCHQCNNLQAPKTLIMELQQLQTRKTNLLQCQQNQKFKESQQSIKDHIEQKHIKMNLQTCSSSNKCVHIDSCSQINQILNKALDRLKQLTQISQNLSKQLQQQKYLKEQAQLENKKLRSQIAKVDEFQCKKTDIIQKQIKKVKTQLIDQSQMMLNVGRKQREVENNQRLMNGIVNKPQLQQTKQNQVFEMISSNKQNINTTNTSAIKLNTLLQSSHHKAMQNQNLVNITKMVQSQPLKFIKTQSVTTNMTLKAKTIKTENYECHESHTLRKLHHLVYL